MPSIPNEESILMPYIQQPDTLYKLLNAKAKTVRDTTIDWLSVSLSAFEDLDELRLLLVDLISRNCSLRLAVADPDAFTVLHPEPEKFCQKFPKLLGMLRTLSKDETERIKFYKVKVPLYNSTYKFGDEWIVVSHVVSLRSINAPIMMLDNKNSLLTKMYYFVLF